MAAEIVFRRPHLTDTVAVLSRMRAADRAECRAGGLTPEVALHHSMRDSPLVWAILAAGEPVALMGCADRGARGAPWMLGTDGVQRHARSLMRRAPPYIAAMLRAFPVLANYVHAENTVAVRWLARMGFRLHPAEPYGAHGAPFHRFEMRR